MSEQVAPPMICLCCGKALEPAERGSTDPLTPPSGATVFFSHGNFGSTLWDPVDDYQHLEVFVCDECLAGRTERAWHVTAGARRPNNTYRTWDPKKG